MGLLALNLLTDAGNFLLPYVIGLKEMLYFGYLGEGHTALIYLLFEDISSISNISIMTIIFLGLIYLFNVIAMLFLLILPTFVWYRFFKGRNLHIPNCLLALILSSLFCFILTPAFFIKKISSERLVGVDVLTQSVLKSHSIIDFIIKDRLMAIIAVCVLAIIFGLLIFSLEFMKKIKNDIFIISVLGGLIFFGYYLFCYFTSILTYYTNTTLFLFESNEFFIIFYFILFAAINILFYIGGYLFFIYEVFKRHFFSQ